jgi:hypothetical protein
MKIQTALSNSKNAVSFSSAQQTLSGAAMCVRNPVQ